MDWVGFDVYVQPELRGSPLAQDMNLWAEEQAVQIARELGKTTTYVLWILQDDAVLDNHFR